MTESIFDIIAKGQRNVVGGDQDSNYERPQRKFPVLRPAQLVENGKKKIYYRIIPLGQRYAFTSYHQIWINVPKADGTVSNNFPIHFPDMAMFPNAQFPVPDIWGGESYNTNNDELYKDLIKIIQYNQSLINDANHPEIKTDVIQLSENRKGFPTRMQTIREVVAIPEVYDANSRQLVPYGQNPVEPNMPPFVNIQLNYSAYSSLMGHILDEDILDQNNVPFDHVLSFIRPDYNMPLLFKQEGNTYSVDLKEKMGSVQPLPTNYLEVGADGLFTHFDDPYRFNTPLALNDDFRNNTVLPHIQDLMSQIGQTQPQQQAWGQPVPQVTVNDLPTSMQGQGQGQSQQTWGQPAPQPQAPQQPNFNMSASQQPNPAQQPTNPAPASWTTQVQPQQPVQPNQSFSGNDIANGTGNAQASLMDNTQPISDPFPTKTVTPAPNPAQPAPQPQPQPQQPAKPIAPDNANTTPATPVNADGQPSPADKAQINSILSKIGTDAQN